MSEPDIKAILTHFDRTADQYFSREELEAKLSLKRQLRIKYGVDVRTPTLHIGHAVNLWLMRYLQDMGHKVVFVIGDFTTRIGDPDGRLESRPMMHSDEIAQNIHLFLDQAKLVLRFDDPNLIEIRRNSEWYDKLTMREFVDLASVVTHARLISRDTFRARIAHNREIYVHETLYPIFQGYDSLVVESDLAIIGSDQLFNESMGRLLQEKHGKPPQTLVTTKVTPGIDGRGKQSKAKGNYIGLAHSPRDKFGRTMSIPDGLIAQYFDIYTEVPYAELTALREMIEKKPRDAKIRLARELVARYHGAEVAKAEEDWFEHTISQGRAPEILPTLAIMSPHIDALDLVALTRPEKSRSDTRRLIRQGGVELDGIKLRNPDELLNVKTNDILKVGKRHWYRLEISAPVRLETEKLWMEPVHLHEIDFLSKYLPAWELVKHLGIDAPETAKGAEAKAREKLRDIIFQKDPKSEWLWKITPKDKPEEILGIAHLHRGPDGKTEDMWIVPGTKGEAEIRHEATQAMNDYAFFMLDFQTMVFKDAFSMATAPKNIDTLSRAFLRMDAVLLNRDTAFGVEGFTHEGWKVLQDWRRTLSPWLFANEVGNTVGETGKTPGTIPGYDMEDPHAPSSKFAAAAADPAPTPAPTPAPKPKPARKPKAARELEPPVPKPPANVPEE